MAAGNGPWMALALLTLLAGLQTPALSEVSVQPNFKQDQFLGRWFTKGLASNATWFQEKKAKLSMCKSVVTAAEDGALNLTVTYFRDTQCITWSLLLEPTGTPGHYRYNKPKWGGNHELLVRETDYDQYAMFITRSTNGPDEGLFMAMLYTRSQDPVAKKELNEKFRSFAHSQGFTDEDIVFLHKIGKCIDDQ
ncbi:prostaglandin-H2 D-isomerase isoform X5 [Suncus etruscus]|uniref:prostaglandin-H2 D-isomerase isoform X5 n=1 Tax=Suncus etruscus TaxID=109475 RepID=UPI0021104C2B|nr:prostaglandin-H2 D-isomerase isoform X5 [Suncus etruscus]